MKKAKRPVRRRKPAKKAPSRRAAPTEHVTIEMGSPQEYGQLLVALGGIAGRFAWIAENQKNERADYLYRWLKIGVLAAEYPTTELFQVAMQAVGECLGQPRTASGVH